MWCTKCNHDFPAECECADRDTRFASLTGASHVALTFCSGCGAYHSLCKCPEPKPALETRNQGRIIR